jgi:hypothetical protein
MNLALQLALEAEGLTKAEVEAVDNAIPAAERIIAAVQKEYPDIATVLPVVQRLLQLAKG